MKNPGTAQTTPGHGPETMQINMKNKVQVHRKSGTKAPSSQATIKIPVQYGQPESHPQIHIPLALTMSGFLMEPELRKMASGWSPQKCRHMGETFARWGEQLLKASCVTAQQN